MKFLSTNLTSIYPFVSDRLVNNKLGIVKDLFYWLPERDDARVFLVAAIAQNFSRMGIEVSTSFNSGAGLTFESAANAAIGETIERYCSAFIQSSDLVLGSYKELSNKYCCVSPKKFAFYNKFQYLESDFPFSIFNESTTVNWTFCKKLGKKEDYLIPAAVTYLPYYPSNDEKLIWYPISTGLSCASDDEEAIVKGIFEVIERDAFSILWYNELPLPKIDITSNEEVYQLYKERFEIPGCKYTLIDMTLDTKIPSVLGILEDERGGILIAAATRLTLKEAVIKTFIELSQGRISWKEDFVQGSKEKYCDDFSDIRDFHSRVMLFTKKSMKSHFNFLPHQNCTVEIQDEKILPYDEQLKILYEKISNLGYDIFYKNLTTSDVYNLDYRVYKVIIPGFIEITNDHLYPRIGGTRIHDVPVTLGLLNKPKTVDEFNKIPHPFP
ncbi:YcaO-like family protein [Streptococcus suis]|uniref:YcaO-like family protein n=1 Tax=Streptococcus suis TaxID=1307 RepID=UPI000943271A|nr:YcaO-like family protein [Streptococcus suis]MDW8637740.1 YcaO-like family protein [Streptococcus suis]WQC88676.1 YcaO-like family protein [Streptococcus suis]HEL2108241.1 YcaO-like family protein [Streptococcus suis]HEL2109501.1 YcaO-like family protein [Streptococcus suis]HEL2403897.1 YcaO-like family protein [Streptococcus suis]